MSTVEETVPTTSSGVTPPRAWLMNILFTATILTSAMLIFAVQPMVSKMLLPPYGGAASVWTTSLLFFQTVLLVGYAYAHYVPKIVGRLHPLVHLVLVVLPLLVLPVTLPSWAAPDESAVVVVRLLLVLCVMVALPFAVLSATGPLVQSWYATLGMPRSHDPYFLYAASNIGSIAGLVAYPFIVEPLVGVQTQTVWWALAYGAFAVLISVCGLVAWRARHAVLPDAVTISGEENATRTKPGDHGPPEEQTRSVITWRRRLIWLALAALPSSLLQGTTTHISTDVAAVPLLWVVPLALYLSTYIIAFGVRRHTWVEGAVDISMVGCVPLILLGAAGFMVPVPVDMLLSLGMLTVIALATHGLLAKDRPGAAHLTEFFLLVSLGGALGSLFNGVAAPLLFNQVLEYPLVLSSVGLLYLVMRRPSRFIQWLGRTRWARLCVLAIGGGAILLGWPNEGNWTIAFAVCVVAIAVLAMLRSQVARGMVFTTTALAFVVLQLFVTSDEVTQGRTFYGSYAISETETARTLAHGTTKHGHQMLEAELARTPVSYYATTGPLGDMFAAYGQDADRVGVVGLGTGAIAAYGHDGQQFDFYEIDPEMVRVARNPEWFTYLHDCACDVETMVGDGRQRLAEEESGTYDVIVLDAFTSDAIPAHMLTREAFEMFADRLAPGGVLAVHVSNRNLDLPPMVGATAGEAGLSGVLRQDANSGENANPHADGSVWIALAPENVDLAALTDEDRDNAQEWYPVPDDGPVWTDGYSSLFGVLRWS